MRLLSFSLSVLAVAATVVVVDVASSGAATAPAPAFSSNNPVVFDFVALGATATKTATAVNAGTAPMTFREVVLTGRDTEDFKIAGDHCTGMTLAPGAGCDVDLVFAPSAAGTRVSNLRFTDDTACQNWINLAGSGTATAAPATARAAACTTAAAAPSGAVSGSSVVTLPKSTTCASRRVVAVGLTAPKGKTFKQVKIFLRGKAIKTLKGKSIRTAVSLKGLPRGRFTLEVRAQTTDGKSYVTRHHYVTCVKDK